MPYFLSTVTAYPLIADHPVLPGCVERRFVLEAENSDAAEDRTDTHVDVIWPGLGSVEVGSDARLISQEEVLRTLGRPPVPGAIEEVGEPVVSPVQR